MSTAPDAAAAFLAAALTGLAFILPISIAGINIALVLITVGLLLHRACGGSLDWRRAWGPVTWCLILYCAVSVLTSLMGVSPLVSLGYLHKDLHKLWVVLVVLLALRAVPGHRLPTALALGFTFAAAYGVARSCWESCHGYGFVWIRAHAFIHPVTYGEMMGLGLLGGFSLWLRPEPRGADYRPYALFSILTATALILSDTRAAILGVMVGFAALCVVESAYRRWLKWGTLAALLCGISMIFLPTGRALLPALRHFWSGAGANAELDRLVLWDVAWRAFRDHPWLGVGPSNYGTVFPVYFHGSLQGYRVWSSAHNISLHQMAERGVVGLAAFLTLVGVMLTLAWRRVRRNPDAWNLWAFSATVAFLVMNLTETAFQIEQIATFFLFIWALGEAGPLLQETQATTAPAVLPSSEILNALLYLFQRYVLRKPYLTATSGYAGLRFHFKTEDALGRHVYKRGTYEAPISEFLLRTLKPRPGDVIIDAGANLGWYSLLLSTSLKPPVRVFAFEPEPRNFKLLRRNLELNSCGTVTAVEKALSDSEGTLPLYLYSDKNLGRHSMLPIYDGPTVQVGTTSLDRFLAEEKIAPERVAFLKIDVEGYELQVLAGAKTVLGKVPLILCEYSPGYMRRGRHEPRALLELLAGAGYAPYLIPGRDPEPTTVDALAESKIGLNVLWSLAPLRAARQ